MGQSHTAQNLAQRTADLKTFQLFYVMLMASSSAHSITVVDFAPTVFTGTGAAEQASMDAALGITGFAIEDFEDSSVISGLTLEFGMSGEISTVPGGNLAALESGIWDGTLGLNVILDPTDPVRGSDLIFRIAGGIGSFGIGVTDIEADNVRLLVNDADLGLISDFPSYSRTGDNSREIYLRIDAGPDETVTSVTIRNLAEGADGLLFDHVALGDIPVPEPAAIVLLGSCLALLAARRF
jgi:hypothetical protein